jgi:hypothetical protein
LNEEGKMKGMTGQRKSLRRGSIKDEKDEKKNRQMEKGWVGGKKRRNTQE